jgi:hypothetical protein
LLQHPTIDRLRELGLEAWPRACVNCRPILKANAGRLSSREMVPIAMEVPLTVDLKGRIDPASG